MLGLQTLFAPYASKRTCWVLLTALLLAMVAQPSLAREEVNSVSTYEAVVEGDTISIFELVQDEEDDDGDAEDPGEEIHVATWSRLRSLLAKKKTDCRKPVNKEKPSCRKPSQKRPSPPPPRPRPSPPPPAPVEEEYVYEAPDMPYEAPVTPMPSPPPPTVVYNQVVCDYTPRRKILSGPRMVCVRTRSHAYPVWFAHSHSFVRSFVSPTEGSERAQDCMWQTRVPAARFAGALSAATGGCTYWISPRIHIPSLSLAPRPHRSLGIPNPSTVASLASPTQKMSATCSAKRPDPTYVNLLLSNPTNPTSPDPHSLTRALLPVCTTGPHHTGARVPERHSILLNCPHCSSHGNEHTHRSNENHPHHQRNGHKS